MLPAIGSICCGNSWVKTAIAVFTTTNDNGKVEELRKIPPPENRKIHDKIDPNLYIAFSLLGSRGVMVVEKHATKGIANFRSNLSGFKFAQPF